MDIHESGEEESGVTDNLLVELNGVVQQTMVRLPRLVRPRDGASEGEWRDYCVALGADRGFVTGVPSQGLRFLAARLGGSDV